MSNGNANGNLKKNSTSFTPSTQPSPEAKKAGWERKRQSQKMMDKVLEYMDMTQKDFMELLTHIKDNPDKHTVGDILLYKYATKAFNGEKFMLDWFDRNISKAPVDLDVTSAGKTITGYSIVFVDKAEDINKNDTIDTQNTESDQQGL